MEGKSATLGGAEQRELRRLEQAIACLLSKLRLLLAVSAVAMVLADTLGDAPNGLLVLLLPYCAYSAVAARRAKRGLVVEESSHAYWIDATCYLAVVGLSGDAASGFSIFLIFPVLAASFHWKMQRGIGIAIACATFVAAISVLHASLAEASGLSMPSPWPSAMLLGSGIVVAACSNSEFALRRRLAILNDLNTLAGSRRGVDWVVRELAEMLRAYQYADSVIVLVGDSVAGCYLFCRTDAGRTGHATRSERISAEVAQILLGKTPHVNLLFSRRRGFWQGTIADAYDRMSLEQCPAKLAELDQFAHLLEADSFVAMALWGKRRAIGRIIATSRHRRFVRSDLAAFQQVIGHATLVIENIELFNRLTAEVVSYERQKISRDLHDGTIQPYIGLKVAVEALRRKIPHDAHLAAEIDDLVKMTNEGITELRRYVNTLGKKVKNTTAESLLVTVRREAEKFSLFSELSVEVVANTDARLNEPMLHEVRSLVREALANIRRHTSARHATINLREENGRVILQFVNFREPSTGAAEIFSPRSLNERASQLGGRVDVEQYDDGRTSVSVEIPMS